MEYYFGISVFFLFWIGLVTVLSGVILYLAFKLVKVEEVDIKKCFQIVLITILPFLILSLVYSLFKFVGGAHYHYSPYPSDVILDIVVVILMLIPLPLFFLTFAVKWSAGIETFKAFFVSSLTVFTMFVMIALAVFCFVILPMMLFLRQPYYY